MWPFGNRDRERVDRLADDLAALTERVEGYVFSLDMYRLDALDLDDDLERASRQHEEVKQLVAGVQHWARARGFTFDQSALSGSSPMSQRAARQVLKE